MINRIKVIPLKPNEIYVTGSGKRIVVFSITETRSKTYHSVSVDGGERKNVTTKAFIRMLGKNFEQVQYSEERPQP